MSVTEIRNGAAGPDPVAGVRAGWPVAAASGAGAGRSFAALMLPQGDTDVDAAGPESDTAALVIPSAVSAASALSHVRAVPAAQDDGLPPDLPASGAAATPLVVNAHPARDTGLTPGAGPEESPATPMALPRAEGDARFLSGGQSERAGQSEEPVEQKAVVQTGHRAEGAVPMGARQEANGDAAAKTVPPHIAPKPPGDRSGPTARQDGVAPGVSDNNAARMPVQEAVVPVAGPATRGSVASGAHVVPDEAARAVPDAGVPVDAPVRPPATTEADLRIPAPAKVATAELSNRPLPARGVAVPVAAVQADSVALSGPRQAPPERVAASPSSGPRAAPAYTVLVPAPATAAVAPGLSAERLLPGPATAFAAAIAGAPDTSGLVDAALAPLEPRAPAPLAATLAPAPPQGTAVADINRQIALRIVTAAEGGPGVARGTVELSLSPEELGRVRLRLHPSEAGLSVTITAERPETLDLLRRNIDSLAREFLEIGYADTDFDFAESGQGARDEQGEEAEPGASGPLASAARTAAQADSPQPAQAALLALGERLDIRL